MDSITQAVLGASLAVVCAPHAPVRRMALYGAVAGTLPDMDVLANPFVSDVQSFVGHRSATHSLLLLPPVAAVLAWAAAKLKLAGLGFGGWWPVLTVVLVTHPLLDLMTSYGTQLLWPLSRYPFSTSSIFIIDPLYTLPLLLGLGLTLRRRPAGAAAGAGAGADSRASGGGRRWLQLALVWSCCYLALGWTFKAAAAGTAREALPAAAGKLTGWQVQNSPPAIVSWQAIAVGAGGTHQAVFYFWQSPQQLVWTARPHYSRRTELIALMRQSPSHRRLMDFSKGLFVLSEHGDGILYRDLRFARSAETSIFSYRIADLSADGAVMLSEPQLLPRSL